MSNSKWHVQRNRSGATYNKGVWTVSGTASETRKREPEGKATGAVAARTPKALFTYVAQARRRRQIHRRSHTQFITLSHLRYHTSIDTSSKSATSLYRSTAASSSLFRACGFRATSVHSRDPERDGLLTSATKINSPRKYAFRHSFSVVAYQAFFYLLLCVI